MNLPKWENEAQWSCEKKGGSRSSWHLTSKHVKFYQETWEINPETLSFELETNWELPCFKNTKWSSFKEATGDSDTSKTGRAAHSWSTLEWRFGNNLTPKEHQRLVVPNKYGSQLLEPNHGMVKTKVTDISGPCGALDFRIQRVSNNFLCINSQPSNQIRTFNVS